MKKINLVYDFDGTFSKNPVPKYLFLEKFGFVNGTNNAEFLRLMNEEKNKNNLETMQAFYKVMFEIVKDKNIDLTDELFEYGVDKIAYNGGLDEYFDAINKYAKENDIELKHYILTSGMQKYLKGIKYNHYFDDVFGCTFKYENKNIVGIDYYLGVNDKVDYLKKVNKDNGFDEDDSSHAIYVGDGMTDYGALKFTHNHGGKSIFVRQQSDTLDNYNELNKENIIDCCEIADYSVGSKLFEYIKSCLK